MVGAAVTASTAAQVVRWFAFRVAIYGAAAIGAASIFVVGAGIYALLDPPEILRIAPIPETYIRKQEELPAPAAAPREESDGIPIARVEGPPAVAAVSAPPDEVGNNVGVQIQTLLDKSRNSPPQESAETTWLGTATGTDGADLPRPDFEALVASIVKCWTPPLGATKPEQLRTVVLVRLNRDGSLNGAPQVVSRPRGKFEISAPESVVRAIGRCAPYNLPSDKYAAWREIEFDFYPVNMFETSAEPAEVKSP